jgi:hypothetical protein
MGLEKRKAKRKTVDAIKVNDITSLSTYTLIAKESYIHDASSKGFLMLVHRNDFVSDDLKNCLSLDFLVGQNVAIFLPQMSLDLDGVITRTAHKGKGLYEIAVDFSTDTPTYWRECLIDLLPAPGEMEEEDLKEN